MSKSYRIHGTRYLRKYSAAERSSIYAYMSDVRKIANSLCDVRWERASRDIAATTTIHTEEGIDWNEPERERFDAAEWCGEHADGFHRAFAQAACYVFELPQSAVGLSIEKLGIQVTSDPYNPYGARISAMTSATLDIPMDCATVREGEVYRAPDEDGMGAAPRLFMRNADGSQNWYANTERVELEPDTPLTAKKYIFVFCCLENYNRGRDGWIEGSSYIDNDVELTLSAACADLVEGELNDLTASRGRTLIRSLNLLDGTVVDRVIEGEVTSITPFGNGDGIGARIAGRFGNLGYSGVSGLALIRTDLENINVAQEPSDEHRLTQGMADLFSEKGSSIFGILGYDYIPLVNYKSKSAGNSILYISERGNPLKAHVDETGYDYTRTSVKCNLSVPLKKGRGYEFYNDRIIIADEDDDAVKVDFSGSVTSVECGFLGVQSLLIAGNNKIAGNSQPVKVLFADGTVADFGIDLTPDDFTNFRAKFVHVNLDYLSLTYDYVFALGKSEISHAKGLCAKTDSTFGSYEFDCGPDGNRMLAWCSNREYYLEPNVLCLTGNFTKIGGVSANGAAVVCFSSAYGSDEIAKCRINLIPFDVGKVKDGAFVKSSSDGLHNGVGVSHLIYIPEE